MMIAGQDSQDSVTSCGCFGQDDRRATGTKLRRQLVAQESEGLVSRDDHWDRRLREIQEVGVIVMLDLSNNFGGSVPQ